jgi:glycosyltransferase involved in cell wall biosynthesis
MKKKYLVSVIIPTYNRCDDLFVAINSVINQTYKNWEIIIIDNYSIDNTFEMINKINDCRIKYYKLHNFGNIALARNHGIELSNGDIVAFLDSDDFWYCDKLEIAINYISQGIDFFFSTMSIKYSVYKSRIFRISTFGNVKSRKIDLFKQLILDGNFISNSSVVIKKSLLLKYGLFDTSQNLITGEDFELWLRISQHNNNYFHEKKSLGYLTYSNNNTSNSKLSLLFLKCVYDKYSIFLTFKEDYMMKKKWYNFSLLYHRHSLGYKINFIDIFKTFNINQDYRKNLIIFRILINNLRK